MMVGMNELSQLWKEVAQVKIQKESYSRNCMKMKKNLTIKVEENIMINKRKNWYIVTWSQTIDQIEYNTGILKIYWLWYTFLW